MITGWWLGDGGGPVCSSALVGAWLVLEFGSCEQTYRHFSVAGVGLDRVSRPCLFANTVPRCRPLPAAQARAFYGFQIAIENIHSGEYDCCQGIAPPAKKRA